MIEKRPLPMPKEKGEKGKGSRERMEGEKEVRWKGKGRRGRSTYRMVESRKRQTRSRGSERRSNIVWNERQGTSVKYMDVIQWFLMFISSSKYNQIVLVPIGKLTACVIHPTCVRVLQVQRGGGGGGG